MVMDETLTTAASTVQLGQASKIADEPGAALPASLVRAGFSETPEGVLFRPKRKWQDYVRVTHPFVFMSVFSLRSPHFDPRLNVFTVLGLLLLFGLWKGRPRTCLGANARTEINSHSGTETKFPYDAISLTPTLIGKSVVLELAYDNRKQRLRARNIDPADVIELRSVLKRHNSCAVRILPKPTPIEKLRPKSATQGIIWFFVLVIFWLSSMGGAFEPNNMPHQIRTPKYDPNSVFVPPFPLPRFDPNNARPQLSVPTAPDTIGIAA
jgi:hypothetical protein